MKERDWLLKEPDGIFIFFEDLELGTKSFRVYSAWGLGKDKGTGNAAGNGSSAAGNGTSASVNTASGSTASGSTASDPNN
jgi:hypothetical protein